MPDTPSRRPPHVAAPPRLPPNPPVPEPRPIVDTPDPDGLSPTRYGDWEKNGIAVDF